MLTRHYAAIVCLSAGLFCCISFTPPAAADQTQPTAVELYQQGMQAYQEGHLQQAQNIFREVDPAQIPQKADRVKMFDTIKAIEQKLHSGKAAQTRPAQPTSKKPAAKRQPPTPQQELAQAQKLSSTNPKEAEQIYQQLATSSKTPKAIQQQAAAGLAQLQRELHPSLTTARSRIDSAARAIQAGDFEAAARQLNAVKASHVQLGWFDQQRLDRELAVVNKHQQAAAEAASVAKAKAKAAAAAKAQAEAQPRASAAEVKAGQPASSNHQAEASQAKPAQPLAKANTQSPHHAQPQPAAANAEASASQSPSRSVVPSQAQTQDLLSQYRRFAIKQRLSEAEKAQRNEQYQLAARRYQQTLDLDPGNAKAEKGLTAVQAAMTQQQQPTGNNLLRQHDNQQQIQIQAARAQYHQDIDNAHRQIKAGNFAAAMASVSDAKLVLDNNRQILPRDEYHTLRSHAESLSAAITDKQQRAQLAKQTRIAQTQKNEAAKKAWQAFRQRQAEVQSLLKRALNLQRDMKYDQALQVVNRALYRDPTNFAAQAIKESIENDQIAVQGRQLERQRNLNTARQAIQTEKESVPPTQLIRYPADWPMITRNRLEEQAQNGGSSENLAVEQALNKPIPVNFDAMQLSTVIGFFRTTTGQNFVANWSALQIAGVQKDTLITLKLKNVSAKQALNLVLQQAAGGTATEPIGYSVINGVVTISTEQNLNTATEIHTYDIRDLLQYIPQVAQPPTFDLQSALSSSGNNTSGGGTGGGSNGTGLFGSTTNNQQQQSQQQAQQKQQFRTNMITKIEDLIKNTVGKPADWYPDTGNSSIAEVNGELVIRTTAQNHQKIRDLLASLRRDRGMQISVEARFLLVTNDFLNDIGAKLDVQINNVGSNFGPIRIAQDSIALAQPTNSVFSSSGSSGGSTSSSSSQGIDPGIFTPGYGFLPETGQALNLGATYISDLEVNLLVKATQADQRSLSLTAPRVTFLNGQEAYVLVADQLAFISDLTPIPDAAGFKPKLSVLQTGVLLDVSGTISADRRYVTLTLNPQLATLVNIQDFTIIGTTTNTAGTTGGNNSGNTITTFTGTIEAPEIQLTEASTTVNVPDRGTLLLGGQRLLSRSDNQAGVPVLSKIPIISRLFTNESTTKSTKTLLILVKPTILINSEQQDKQFPGLSQNPMNYNAGRNYSDNSSDYGP